VPYRPFLDRIRKLLSVRPGAHFDSTAHGFRSGRPRPPARPMTDQELARAIREFQAAIISDCTRGKPADQFDKK
jgi:hypothetical protein